VDHCGGREASFAGIASGTLAGAGAGADALGGRGSAVVRGETFAGAAATGGTVSLAGASGVLLGGFGWPRSTLVDTGEVRDLCK